MTEPVYDDEILIAEAAKACCRAVGEDPDEPIRSRTGVQYRWECYTYLAARVRAIVQTLDNPPPRAMRRAKKG